MSIESAKAFYLTITTDEAFRSQFQNAASDNERRTIMQTAGYSFTPKEWEAAKTQILEPISADSELSDAELEAIAGGRRPPVALYGLPAEFV
jgi:predicted ribosomally synthesized peptide with nif11-like leader